MEGFLRYRFGGLIFGGAYFRNFTVAINLQLLLKATSTTRLTLRMRHGWAYTRSFVLDCHVLYLQHFISIE